MGRLAHGEQSIWRLRLSPQHSLYFSLAVFSKDILGLGGLDFASTLPMELQDKATAAMLWGIHIAYPKCFVGSWMGKEMFKIEDNAQTRSLINRKDRNLQPLPRRINTKIKKIML